MISTTGSIAQKILLPAPRRASVVLPGPLLDFRTSDALADFDQGIDVAIRFGPGGWRGLQSRLLASETLFPVVGPALSRRRLADQPGRACRPCPDPPSRKRLAAVARPGRAGPDATAPALYLDNQVLVTEAAAAGHGRGPRPRADRGRRSALRPSRPDPRSGGSGRIWLLGGVERELAEGGADPRLRDAVEAVFTVEANSSRG